MAGLDASGGKGTAEDTEWKLTFSDCSLRQKMRGKTRKGDEGRGREQKYDRFTLYDPSTAAAATPGINTGICRTLGKR